VYSNLAESFGGCRAQAAKPTDAGSRKGRLAEMIRISPAHGLGMDAARHEAGHCIAYWYYGWRFRYVTMRPRKDGVLAGVRNYGSRVCDTPAKLITSMAIAAAGRIAQFPVASDAASDSILRSELDRIASTVPLTGYPDPDMRQFVGAGLELDVHHVLPAGPDGWLDVWHNAEDQISGPLWPAVMAVAGELMASPRRLSYKQVAAIAAAAVPDSVSSTKPLSGLAPGLSRSAVDGR
jgi:hypothetical protein